MDIFDHSNFTSLPDTTMGRTGRLRRELVICASRVLQEHGLRQLFIRKGDVPTCSYHSHLQLGDNRFVEAVNWGVYVSHCCAIARPCLCCSNWSLEALDVSKHRCKVCGVPSLLYCGLCDLVVCVHHSIPFSYVGERVVSRICHDCDFEDTEDYDDDCRGVLAVMCNQNSRSCCSGVQIPGLHCCMCEYCRKARPSSLLGECGICDGFFCWSSCLRVSSGGSIACIPRSGLDSDFDAQYGGSA